MFRFMLVITILILTFGCSQEQPLTPEPQTIIVEVPCPEPPAIQQPPAPAEPQQEAWEIRRTGVAYVAPDGTEIAVNFGDTLAQLQAIPKMETIPLASGFGLKHPDLGLIAQIGVMMENDKVHLITIFQDERYQTDRGIHTGSTRADMLHAYGPPVAREWLGGFHFDGYPGIAFGFKADDKIEIIMIGQ